jgi:hypothetical protein
LELELPLFDPFAFPLFVLLLLAVPLSVLVPEVPLLPWPADPVDPLPWLADDPDDPWSCPMLLPEELLPDPLLPCEAELPDCPLPLAEPLLPVPLCAIANAAETTNMAKSCSTRFIELFLSSCLSVLSTAIPRWIPSSEWRYVRPTGAGTVSQAITHKSGDQAHLSRPSPSVADNTAKPPEWWSG